MLVSNEHFLLFPQCFQKSVFHRGHYNIWGLPGNMFTLKAHSPFPKQVLVFSCLQYKSFENTVGKGEIAHNNQFLLFPQCFLFFWGICFHQIQNCRLHTLSVWRSRKFVVWERVKLGLRTLWFDLRINYWIRGPGIHIEALSYGC